MGYGAAEAVGAVGVVVDVGAAGACGALGVGLAVVAGGDVAMVVGDAGALVCPPSPHAASAAAAMGTSHRQDTFFIAHPSPGASENATIGLDAAPFKGEVVGETF